MLFAFLTLLLLQGFVHSSSPICLLPKSIGPCEAAMPRYFYNTESEKCESFLYGGCRGNANNFETLSSCEQSCGKNMGNAPVNWSNAFCLLAPEVGPCKAYFVRYYYDAQSGSCQNFVYGGCGGNANNFEDSEICLKTCS